MTDLYLHGIAWNHSRAFPPLIAVSQRYEELHPRIHIEWEKRSLDDFGHAGVTELARSYDLLVIDHPMLGDVHRNGALLDLQARIQPAELAELEADALGPCFESYRYEGCLYALPIDAAAPAASYRADLLDRRGLQPPADWNELIDTARCGLARMPGFPADVFLNLMGMCASRSSSIACGDNLFDRGVAMLCLEELRELAAFMPLSIYGMNPIDIYEAMSSGNEFAYCPFAYTYSNYSRPGFAAHTLLFENPVTLRGGTPQRTILGGTGIAVSTGCAHADVAIDFSLYAAGRDCQSHIYGICGGQPASKVAWRDPLLNRVSNNFFERTVASIEAAYVRPRYAGYIGLQHSAGNVVAACLQHKLTAMEALRQIEELYRKSLIGAQCTQEPAR